MIILVPGIGPRRIPDNTPQGRIDAIMAAANDRLARQAVYTTWRQPDKLAEIDAYLVTVGFDPPTMDGGALSRIRERVRMWKSGQINEASIVPPLNADELTTIK